MSHFTVLVTKKNEKEWSDQWKKLVETFVTVVDCHI